MSCNYAEGLSPYENKGKLGLPEKFDDADVVEKKAKILGGWLMESKHVVVHTGAGISTAAGIPDFRGPNGVWTLEEKGLKPSIDVTWDDARPTFTHMALLTLLKKGLISYVITQNIDGLHLRSGLPRKNLAQLHGDMFVDKCQQCKKEFVRSSAATTVGQKSLGVPCPGRKGSRGCRGKLFDTILDWENDLPDSDIELSDYHSCAADLSLCLGTTLQIVPSGNLPVYSKRRGGKLVICNLQPTKHDKQADLIINTYVDELMKSVLKILQIKCLEYDPTIDPVMIVKNHKNQINFSINSQDTKIAQSADSFYPSGFKPFEWTIQPQWLKDKTLLQRVKDRKVVPKKRKSLDSNNIMNDVPSKCETECKPKRLNGFIKEEKVKREDYSTENNTELNKNNLNKNKIHEGDEPPKESLANEETSLSTKKWDQDDTPSLDDLQKDPNSTLYNNADKTETNNIKIE